MATFTGIRSQGDGASAVAIDPSDGSVYVAGSGENLIGSETSSDWWIKKFSSSGVEDTTGWNKMFDSAESTKKTTSQKQFVDIIDEIVSKLSTLKPGIIVFSGFRDKDGLTSHLEELLDDTT